MVYSMLEAGDFRQTVNRYMTRVGVFLVAVALTTMMVGCEAILAPDPTPYNREIRNWHDLHAVRHHPGRSYVLMNDLDSATPGYIELAGSTADQGKGWQPIGTSDERFTGSLDGQGYEIRDLFINRSDETLVGLFGAVGEGGGVQNVGVVNAGVIGEWGVGCLVGANWGTVSDSYSSGSVSGDDHVGGLVGGNAGGVSNSYSNASVDGHWDVGGLVGANDSRGAVSNSYSDGSVTGELSVGGLVGGNLGGTVSKSYASASVNGDDYVGGLVGDNQGAVSNSYFRGSVTGEWHVGGLVGYNEGSVSNSYSTGSVAGSVWIGGLVGSNRDGTVSNSFWDRETSGMEQSGGGTGKSSGEMQDIVTFTNTATVGLDQRWDIAAVAPDETESAFTWNIVDGQTYPFLSWQSM
jgi:hypothetical protein